MKQNEIERLTVSAPEAARMLGVSKPKIYEIMREPGFPVFKLGGRTLISVDGLRRWVDKQAGSCEQVEGM